MTYRVEQVSSASDLCYGNTIAIRLPQKGNKWYTRKSDEWLNANADANNFDNVPQSALFTLRHYPLEVILQLMDASDRNLILDRYLHKCTAQDLRGKSLQDIIVSAEDFDQAEVEDGSVQSVGKGGRVGSIIGGGLVVGGVDFLLEYLKSQGFVEKLKEYFESALASYMLGPIGDSNWRSHWHKAGLTTGHCLAIRATSSVSTIEVDYEGQKLVVEAPVLLDFVETGGKFHLQSSYADLTAGGVMFTGVVGRGRCWNDRFDNLDIGGDNSATEWNTFQIFRLKTS